MMQLSSVYKNSLQIINIYERQLLAVKKAVNTLHEDLQYDFNIEIEKLEKE
jgi:hypothetical protein